MASRRPLTAVAGRIKELPSGDSLKVGNASFDPTSLTTSRTVTLPDKSGPVAMTDDVAGGDIRDTWLFG